VRLKHSRGIRPRRREFRVARRLDNLFRRSGPKTAEEKDRDEAKHDCSRLRRTTNRITMEDRCEEGTEQQVTKGDFSVLSTGSRGMARRSHFTALRPIVR